MTRDEWDQAEAERVRKNREVIETLRARGCVVETGDDSHLAFTPRPYPGDDKEQP